MLAMTSSLWNRYLYKNDCQNFFFFPITTLRQHCDIEGSLEVMLRESGVVRGLVLGVVLTP